MRGTTYVLAQVMNFVVIVKSCISDTVIWLQVLLLILVFEQQSHSDN